MQTNQQQENQIATTQVSLPKGGGAIQGIGEKFQADEFTGTVSLSIPIKTSSCRGFEPQLSIDYSSGSGNGSFGLGFNLSITNIARKTSKGLPKYDRSDTFILFNGDDLVPVTNLIRHEILNKINYTVRSYQPRSEGLFAIIEYWVAENGDSFWKILSRDNVTSIFGKTENSRIFDPDNPSHIFEWLVSETFNPQGDRVVYQYKSENTDNIPNAVYEVNRTQIANKYIEKIKYGNVRPFFQHDRDQIEQWHFEVVFDYGEYNIDLSNTTPYTPVRDWSNRQDSFSTYQAGFEIRSHRLCRKILMFHRFEAEFETSEPILVNATSFSYQETPILTQLIGVEYVGYSYENGQYKKKQLPPLEFKYTEFEPNNRNFEPLLSQKGQFLPGLDLPPNYSLVDLYGEGIPGILYADGQTTLYWEAEIKQNSDNKKNISYAAPRTIETFPIDRNVGGATQQLMDLTGNGQLELVVSRGGATGYYEANSDRTWTNFQTFPSFPNDFSHPDNQLLDATGDGLTDILRMESDRIWLYPGQGKQGFDKPSSRNREKSIPLPRKGSEEEIWQFTDIFGTGMQHLVRVTNGLVECWPHLGYGKFGKRVLLDNAPRYGARLDASRLFLADIDGSGTADLIYAHPDRVEIWFNQSGNAFSEPITIYLPSKWDRLNQIRFADIYGNGTNCLIFSDNHIKPQHWCYDFCQRRKPYLLNQINNNLGARSTITYASSTKFYLEDKKKGFPWIVNLPFPVQVVEKTESFDLISASKMVSSYAYHHGYYDGVEREFCGFGLVERKDAETLEDLLKSDRPSEEAKDYHVPPILTKTWYHTGAWQREDSLSRQYEKEYFQGDSRAYEFPDSIFADLNSLPDAETSRQARWALKGMVLRQEVYGLDNTSLEDQPYAVTETNYRVKLLQAKGDNRYGVYFVEPRETLSYQYERNPEDPRINHQFVLKVDDYGNVIRSCAIAYGRRKNIAKNVFPEQLSLKVISEENSFINRREENINLLGIPQENKSYEITNLNLESGKEYFSFAEVNDYLEDILDSSESQLLDWQRHYYWSPELSESLPLGRVTPEALPDRTEMAEFSRDRIQETFNSALDREKLSDLLNNKGGYKSQENYWWNPGLKQTYNSKEKFFLPKETRDPFDNITSYEYDRYHLLPVKVTAPLNNQMVVEAIDYQTLQPQRIKDINQNISEVIFDPMGMVIVSSFYGTENDGQPQGFAQLAEYQIQEVSDLKQLLDNPDDYLQSAASYFYYDLFAWKNRKIPVHAVNLIAENYPNNSARTLVQISYSDGFGRELQTKVKADSGTALFVNDDGTIETKESSDRWLTSGRTIYNNKGNPVKQYEPYYLDTYEYVDNKTLNYFGVSPTLYYDPLERVICVETAKRFFSKVEFNPWSEKNYDENDTVKDSNFYKNFLENYPANPTEEQRNEKDALTKATEFDDTPVIQILDSLGNTFLLNDNGLISYFKYDIKGRVIESIDPRLYTSNLTKGTTYYNFKYQYPMSGDTPWVEDSADGGITLNFNNVFGNLLWNLSPRNFEQIIDYDELQRKSEIRTKGIKNDGTIVTDNLVEKYTYGESQANPEDNNLRGKLYQLQDQSGIITNSKYNLQGNILESDREFTQTYDNYINWDENIQLERENYARKFTFNAIQKLITETTPDGSIKTNNYNRLGLLEKISVTLPDNTEQPIINNIEYNAKGQRIAIAYANGVNTTYSYEETTWRLIQLQSTRSNLDNQGNPRNSILQNISYTYDPVGNITRLKDNSHETVFHNNQKVEPLSDYTYDRLYRLIKANGRQHRSINSITHKNNAENEDFKQSKFIPLSNREALEKYQESYTYDDAGNLTKTTHTATNSWTRTNEIREDSNRLKTVSSTNGFSDRLDITYDRSGNQEQLNGNSTIKLTFNCCENLVRATIIERQEQSDRDYYTYDSDEMRTRKISERLISNAVIEKESKIYLGNYEIKTLQQNQTTILKRQTLRIMDDKTCVAIIHYWEKDDLKWEVEQVGTRKLRYQLDNHLGSVSLAVDNDARIISYEEYFPYGGTAFIAGSDRREVKLKEYRYSGKERDDSTGLYYYGARYYAPWLGRWLKPDPAGTVDGLNLYGFVGGNPLVHVDVKGLESDKKKKNKKRTKKQAKENARDVNSRISKKIEETHEQRFQTHGHAIQTGKTEQIRPPRSMSSEEQVVRHISTFLLEQVKGAVEVQAAISHETKTIYVASNQQQKQVSKLLGRKKLRDLDIPTDVGDSSERSLRHIDKLKAEQEREYADYKLEFISGWEDQHAETKIVQQLSQLGIQFDFVAGTRRPCVSCSIFFQILGVDPNSYQETKGAFWDTMAGALAYADLEEQELSAIEHASVGSTFNVNEGLTGRAALDVGTDSESDDETKQTKPKRKSSRIA